MNRRDRRSHPAPPLYPPSASAILNAVQQGGALSVAFSQLTGVPTTLAGYGITDAYTQAEVDALIAAAGGSLAGLSDVLLTGLADGEMLAWDAVASKWINVPAPSGGAGSIDGSGTAGTIAKWSDSDTLADSLLTDDGANIISSGPVVAQAGVAFTGGAFAAAKIYSTAALGLVVAGGVGSSVDLLLTNGVGSSLLDNPNGGLTLRLYGDFIPNVDAAQDLGSSSAQFQDLYLSGGIYIGGSPLGSGSGSSPSGFHAGTTNMEVRYIASLGTASSLTSYSLAAISGRTFLVPFVAPARGGTIDLLAVNVSVGTVGSNVTLGIYETLSETNIYPGALLASGSVGTASAGMKEVAVSVALTPGRVYWIAAEASATISVSGVSVNSTSGAFVTATETGSMRTHMRFDGGMSDPANTTFVNLTGNIPAFFYRFSA